MYSVSIVWSAFASIHFLSLDHTPFLSTLKTGHAPSRNPLQVLLIGLVSMTDSCLKPHSVAFLCSVFPFRFFELRFTHVLAQRCFCMWRKSRSCGANHDVRSYTRSTTKANQL